jgi:hypothetical protein
MDLEILPHGKHHNKTNHSEIKKRDKSCLAFVHKMRRKSRTCNYCTNVKQGLVTLATVANCMPQYYYEMKLKM